MVKLSSIQQAVETTKQKYGKDFYSKIGTIGGSKKVPKGFAVNIEIAKAAGRKGGKISKNGKDFYSKIGTIGGSKKVPKGFALNRELASIAGRKGGKISKRTK